MNVSKEQYVSLSAFFLLILFSTLIEADIVLLRTSVQIYHEVCLILNSGSSCFKLSAALNLLSARTVNFEVSFQIGFGARGQSVYFLTIHPKNR